MEAAGHLAATEEAQAEAEESLEAVAEEVAQRMIQVIIPLEAQEPGAKSESIVGR